MARSLASNDLIFYRAVCDSSYYGPYNSIGVAKVQASNRRSRWSDPKSKKIQKLGIAIDDYPDDIVARLAWFDVAEYKDGKWVDISAEDSSTNT